MLAGRLVEGSGTKQALNAPEPCENHCSGSNATLFEPERQDKKCVARIRFISCPRFFLLKERKKGIIGIENKKTCRRALGWLAVVPYVCMYETDGRKTADAETFKFWDALVIFCVFAVSVKYLRAVRSIDFLLNLQGFLLYYNILLDYLYLF